MSHSTLAQPTPSAPPATPTRQPSPFRTRGTWSTEQARAAGIKGRAAFIRNCALRRAHKDALKAMALNPSTALPQSLQEQIDGTALLIDQYRKERKAGEVKKWIGILRSLIDLQRYIQNPPARSKAAGTAERSPAPSLTLPRLAPAGPPAASPTPEPSADLPPIQPEPLD
jgi:hypothetical protein